jgi:hypothetical protein
MSDRQPPIHLTRQGKKTHMNKFTRSIIILGSIASVLLPQLAFSQSREVTCGNTTYARIRTQNFYVNICGNARPTQYVGTSKGGQAIVLPLSSSARGKFVAVNGNVRYTLTPSFLTVTQGGKTIVKERVTEWAADGMD